MQVNATPPLTSQIASSSGGVYFLTTGDEGRLRACAVGGTAGLSYGRLAGGRFASASCGDACGSEPVSISAVRCAGGTLSTVLRDGFVAAVAIAAAIFASGSGVELNLFQVTKTEAPTRTRG